ncbi:hypothetical protein ACTWPB_01435 [Nocardia sp. IBHARD005]|uniref:hypothetical protein n=1 Tax=Nocardia sp. IBHARD005 TaxID=3457765 RepID=UPI0040590DBC
MSTLRQAWHDGFSELANLSSFTTLALNRIFGEGKWDGNSGDAGLAAALRHAQAANQIAQVFGTMADRMGTVVAAAEATRAAVPPPVAVMGTIDPDDPLQSVLPGLVSPEYMTQHRKAAEQARLAAVAAMNNVYTPNYPPTGNGVPSYTTVASIGDNGAGGTSGPSSGAPASSPSGSATGDPATGEVGVQGTPTTGDPSGNGSAAASQGEETGSAGSESGSETAAASTAAPTAGQEAGARTGGNPVGTGGSPSGGGAGGAGTPGGGLTTGSPRTPGGTGAAPIAGTPNSGRSGPAGGAGSPGASTAGRTAGHPMGGPGAGAGRRGGGGDGDAEKYAPDYLRGIQSDWLSGISANSGVLGENPELGEARDVPLARPRPVPTPVVESSSAGSDLPGTPNSGTTAAATASSNAASSPASPASDVPTLATSASGAATSTAEASETSDTQPSTSAVTGEAPMLDDLFAEYGWAPNESTPAETSPASDGTTT